MQMKLYPRLAMLQFLQFFVWGSWFVTAGTYLIQALDFSGREVGLVYANNAIAATITPFALGIMADRYFSIEKMLSILHFVGGVLLLCASFLEQFVWFYPVMLIYVLCYLPTFSLSNALCFHHITSSKNDFPKIRVWGTIAWIAAGLIVGSLQWEATVYPFRMAGISSIILSLYSMTLPPTPPKLQANTNMMDFFKNPDLQKIFKDKSFVILVLSVGLICIPTSYYYSFTNPFLNEMGVTNSAGKMAIGQISEIILMLLLPWFFNHLRLKVLLFIGLFTWGARYGLFVLGIHYQAEWMYMMGIFLHGVAYIFAILSAQIYIDTKSPVHLRSTAQGFFSFLTLGLGAFVGTYLAGEMVNYYTYPSGQHNWSAIWTLPAVFGILVSIFFYFSFRSKEKA